MLRYAITDRARFSGDEPARQATLIQQAERLAADGVDFIQLREKDLTTDTLVDLARKLLTTLRAHQPAPRLLINSRADIAIATHADGVHLTSAPGSLTPAQVRTLYAAASLPDPIVSLSCHSLAEVARAAANPNEHPTLILFGPVFEKVVAEEVVSKYEISADHALTRSIGEHTISAGTGLDILRAACQAAAPTPVLALGGINLVNTAATLAAGAAGVAAIRLYLE